MIIKVTRRHIDIGCRLACSDCPVALAIKDVFEVRCLVNVNGGYLIIGDIRFSVKLPERVTVFVRMFDDYDITLGKVKKDNQFTFKRSKFKPFTFNLSAECFML